MDLTSSHPLQRRSLGDQIADRLRQEILLGRLAPGTAVSQQRLCDDYGTSRMPVRDALVKLTGEGLVETTPGGQSVVAALTARDIIDAFDIAGLVHGRAARRAATAASDEDVEQLAALHDGMVEAHAAGDLNRIGDLNWAFHKRINQLSGSAKLIAVMRSVSIDIPRGYLSELPGWADEVNREHEAIVAAFHARDGKRAEKAVAEHLRRAGANLASYLEAKGQLATA